MGELRAHGAGRIFHSPLLSHPAHSGGSDNALILSARPDKRDRSHEDIHSGKRQRHAQHSMEALVAEKLHYSPLPQRFALARRLLRLGSALPARASLLLRLLRPRCRFLSPIARRRLRSLLPCIFRLCSLGARIAARLTARTLLLPRLSRLGTVGVVSRPVHRSVRVVIALIVTLIPAVAPAVIAIPAAVVSIPAAVVSIAAGSVVIVAAAPVVSGVAVIYKVGIISPLPLIVVVSFVSHRQEDVCPILVSNLHRRQPCSISP